MPCGAQMPAGYTVIARGRKRPASVPGWVIDSKVNHLSELTCLTALLIHPLALTAPGSGHIVHLWLSCILLLPLRNVVAGCWVMECKC